MSDNLNPYTIVLLKGLVVACALFAGMKIGKILRDLHDENENENNNQPPDS